ncbi:hypothetical protein GCM10009799_50780 [Nocardiopsis rhodophaea]|uniref:Uncharacterized protein n=1 Tax=Nocardiopsis rhodophaea TaxID=280238 RepID=A0ABP5F944_9ACTN
MLARRRMILPEPVTLKRLLAPLCDLFFGIVAVVSYSLGTASDWGGAVLLALGTGEPGARVSASPA